MTDIEVIEVLPGDRAIISTVGMCRVVTPSGVMAELVEQDGADEMAAVYNECMRNRPGERATVEQYAVEAVATG